MRADTMREPLLSTDIGRLGKVRKGDCHGISAVAKGKFENVWAYSLAVGRYVGYISICKSAPLGSVVDDG